MSYDEVAAIDKQLRKYLTRGYTLIKRADAVEKMRLTPEQEAKRPYSAETNRVILSYLGPHLPGRKEHYAMVAEVLDERIRVQVEWFNSVAVEEPTGFFLVDEERTEPMRWLSERGEWIKTITLYARWKK